MQEVALRAMPDIVVATPGRMIDHLRNSMSVDLDDLAVLILDEADRLLELGFSAEIHELVLLTLIFMLMLSASAAIMIEYLPLACSAAKYMFPFYIGLIFSRVTVG